MGLLFKNLLSNEDGVTVIEYGLIVALIALAALLFFQLVGESLSDFFNFASDKMDKVVEDGNQG